MKNSLKISLLLLVCTGSILIIQAETEQPQFCSQLKVGQKAPDFTAKAAIVQEEKDISLSDYNDSFKVIVFYPADFSFICPTELRALQKDLDKFKEKNAQVIAVSVDNIYSHLKWLATPEKENGIKGVSYPIISDITKQISRDYGVLDEKAGVALRGVFILDKKNIVQAAMINNLAIGRSTDEILRVLSAIQHIQQFGDGCPVNWQEGDEGISLEVENDS